MKAKLTTIMGIRAVVTGFGQVAMQMKNSPRVASVGRAAMSRDSSTTPNIVSALESAAIRDEAAVCILRLSGSRIVGSESDGSRSPDRAPRRAHAIHGDRHVKRALPHTDRRNGEIRGRAGRARQIDDGPVIGLAVLKRPKCRGTADLETVVDPLVDIRAHNRVRAVEHAHKVLALVAQFA